MSREQLMDPMQCAGCHPDHYREWKSSMHAYAARDPVFIAMNERGQRETDGGMGDFCVRCHAPMALLEGATTNGTNLAEVDDKLKGVTCYFCHSASGYGEPHNNSLTLRDDAVMVGPVKNPIDPGVHGVGYAKTHDPDQPESAALCGSCHDVVSPAGAHIERTFAEYQETIFADHGGARFNSCQTCHMRPYSNFKKPIAVMPGVQLPDRTMHAHLWPAVDVALEPDFPDLDVQRNAVLCELQQSLTRPILTANDPVGRTFSVLLESGAGHSQPSGAAQDRRLWVEATAYDAQGRVLFESGAIADTEIEEYPKGTPGYDPFLTMLRDHMYDAEGREVHMFWEAASTTSRLLKGQPSATAHPSLKVDFSLPVLPARFTVRLRMRPVGMDVLQSLVDSGDLNPAVLERMPTFTLGEATWTPADRTREITILGDLRCPSVYECQLYPESSICR